MISLLLLILDDRFVLIFSCVSVADAYALYKGRRRPSSALVLDSTDYDYGDYHYFHVSFSIAFSFYVMFV